MNESQIPWRELLAVLHRRRKFILQIFFGGLITVLISVWLQGPMYRASATLMVTSDRAQIVVSPDANTRPSVERVTEQDMNGEVALIHSESLVREVLQPFWNTELHEEPSAFDRIMSVLTFPLRIPSLLYRKMHGIPPLNGLEIWAHNTLTSLSVSILGKSSLIQVDYYAGKPEWAAAFVNKLVARHLERRAKLSQVSEARSFYESQRDVLNGKAQAAEAALLAFNRNQGMETMSAEQRQALRARLQDAQNQLTASETELAEATARAQFLASEIKNYPRNIPTESKIAQNQQFIQPKILELELLRSELLSKYAAGSVKVRDIDRQIAQARRLMKSNPETLAETTNTINPAFQNLEVDLAHTKAQIAAVGARVEALRGQVTEKKATVAHLDEVSSEQERLEQDLASAKESFLTYSKKEEEARFSSALDESSFVDIAVVEPAEVPTSPEKSKRMFTLAVGTGMSLLAALALAFLRDRLDPAVKSASEAKSVTGLPILAEVR